MIVGVVPQDVEAKALEMANELKELQQSKRGGRKGKAELEEEERLKAEEEERKKKEAEARAAALRKRGVVMPNNVVMDAWVGGLVRPTWDTSEVTVLPGDTWEDTGNDDDHRQAGPHSRSPRAPLSIALPATVLSERQQSLSLSPRKQRRGSSSGLPAQPASAAHRLVVALPMLPPAPSPPPEVAALLRSTDAQLNAGLIQVGVPAPAIELSTFCDSQGCVGVCMTWW